MPTTLTVRGGVCKEAAPLKCPGSSSMLQAESTSRALKTHITALQAGVCALLGLGVGVGVGKFPGGRIKLRVSFEDFWVPWASPCRHPRFEKAQMRLQDEEALPGELLAGSPLDSPPHLHWVLDHFWRRTSGAQTPLPLCSCLSRSQEHLRWHRRHARGQGRMLRFLRRLREWILEIRDWGVGAWDLGQRFLRV